jgi:hypothetical protein
MTARFDQKVGTYEGRSHLLYWEARPNLDELHEFVVNLSYADFVNGEPRRIQIVRIDNVDKPLHMDELWKDGRPKRWLDWPGSRWELFSRALEELHDNWQLYAERRARNRAY